MKKIKLFSLIALAAAFAAVSCNKDQQPAGEGETPTPAAEFNDYFGERITAISESVVWSDATFNAIIDAEAAGATEYNFEATMEKPDFVKDNLGFLGGSWKDAQENVKYGTFKFKKDEKISDTAKKSRVQIAGGKVGDHNNLAFRAAGAGKLTVIFRSSGDAGRFINVAVNANLLSEEGFAAPAKADAPATLEQEINAAAGDVITVFSMGSSINVYSVKWVPAGKTDPEEGQGGGGEPGEPGVDDPSIITYDAAIATAVTEKTTWGASYFTALCAAKADYEATAQGESFGYGALGFLAGEGEVMDWNATTSAYDTPANKKGQFKFTTSRVQIAMGAKGTVNNVVFKVDGAGTVTVKAIGANSTDNTRVLHIALDDEVLVSEAMENSKGAAKDVTATVTKAGLVYIYANNAVNVTSIVWTPAGEEGGDTGANVKYGYYDSTSTFQDASGYFTATAKVDLVSPYAISSWTINDLTSTKGIKLNSSGNVSFTTSDTLDSSVEFWFILKSSTGTGKIQIIEDGKEEPLAIFETPYAQYATSGAVALEKGKKYIIKQKSGEQALLLVAVTETEAGK